MADKKEKDQEPKEVIVREVVVGQRRCQICYRFADDVQPARIRITPPIDGVIDPEYEHNYGTLVCGACRTEINLACANTEIAVVNAIFARSAEERERDRRRAYLLQAWEEIEEEKAARKAAENEEGEKNIV